MTSWLNCRTRQGVLPESITRLHLSRHIFDVEVNVTFKDKNISPLLLKLAPAHFGIFELRVSTNCCHDSLGKHRGLSTFYPCIRCAKDSRLKAGELQSGGWLDTSSRNTNKDFEDILSNYIDPLEAIIASEVFVDEIVKLWDISIKYAYDEFLHRVGYRTRDPELFVCSVKRLDGELKNAWVEYE